MSSNNDNLTHEEALSRSKQVANVRYKLHLTLEDKQPDYEGEATVSFAYKAAGGEASSSSSSLFLDFITKTIHKLTINGSEVKVDAEALKRNRVTIDSSLLNKEGSADNHVTLRYTNAYDTTGNGFHRFVDPEDGHVYIYTHFEPFYAHRLIPCFDQPDIRAPLDLTVVAPAAWAVVANSRCKEISSAAGDQKQHVFEPTPPISSYLYALVAGAFVSFEDKYKEVPMAIYCRRTLKSKMEDQVKELFTITKEGLGYYEDFFGCAYPFVKYDQLFVPEFNIGAMENPGCITFTEAYIPRETPTMMQRQRRAETVLHEMAHMWFGDLVSPVWWDGLWLNESFASVMAFFCMAAATQFAPTAWMAFHNGYKRWAYREDQLSTTHPIQGAVPDTNSTFQNFDGITYGKGASVLKQLVAVLGEEGFRDGMRVYFKRHAWGNTTIQDFLKALQDGAKNASLERDDWPRLWLENAGLNTLTPEWSAENGKISSFFVHQGAPSTHPTLRPHVVHIALYDKSENGPVLRTVKRVQVTANASIPVSELVGEAAPSFVWLAHGDHVYAKIMLDHASLEYARDNLDKFPDSFMRALLWSSMATMVRDTIVPAPQYLALVRAKIGSEKDNQLVQSIIATVQGTIANFVPDDMKQKEKELWHAECLSRLSSFRGGSSLLEGTAKDEPITWIRAAAQSVSNAAAIENMWVLADKGTGISGVEIEQDVRWTLVRSSLAYSVAGARDRLDMEISRDSSDRGKRAAEGCRTSVADAQVKAEAWARFTSSSSETASRHMLSSAMAGFGWWHQRIDLLAPYIGKFFDVVHDIFKNRSLESAEDFYGGMFPSYALSSPEVLQRSEALLATLDPQNDTVLRRSLRESIDDIHRAAACHALASKK